MALFGHVLGAPAGMQARPAHIVHHIDEDSHMAPPFRFIDALLMCVHVGLISLR